MSVHIPYYATFGRLCTPSGRIPSIINLLLLLSGQRFPKLDSSELMHEIPHMIDYRCSVQIMLVPQTIVKPAINYTLHSGSGCCFQPIQEK